MFEDHKFTLAELKEALENNFGYPIPATGSQPILRSAGDPKYSVGNMSLESMNLVNEPKAGGAGAVADCVARPLQQYGRPDLCSGEGTAERRQRGQSGRTAEDGQQQCMPGPGPEQGGGFKQIIPNARWEEMLTIMRNTPGFGNDIDEIDKYAVRCGEIYCEQVEKYTNARGGKFQAGMYPVSANVLYGKDVMALPTAVWQRRPSQTVCLPVPATIRTAPRQQQTPCRSWTMHWPVTVRCTT